MVLTRTIEIPAVLLSYSAFWKLIINSLEISIVLSRMLLFNTSRVFSIRYILISIFLYDKIKKKYDFLKPSGNRRERVTVGPALRFQNRAQRLGKIFERKAGNPGEALERRNPAGR